MQGRSSDADACTTDTAPSPSKRPRLDGTPFNQQQMPNGRGQGGMPQQVGDTGPSNAIQAAHMQLANGIESNNLTAQQFPNIPGGQNNNPAAQARQLAGYQQNLAQQQNAQMATVKAMPNQGGPANQGSPMMTPGQDSGSIANYYNPGDIGANGMRNGPGGAPGGGGGNHALQDYQMQLMLLEQQNKKRLMMARQEQGEIIRPEGSQGAPGAVGPNGQPFQGTSPQGRSVNSPNPNDQMKRGTPHMNNAGMPSPLPEGQSRGSPSAGINFNMSGQMDPSMNPQYFKMGNNGMDPNMAGAMPNGMRPPSSHPGAFNNGMNAQHMQMAQARQQQMQQGAAVQNWANGPNGQMMPQGAQGPPQQNIGTPQQRAMPPPSAPAAAAAATNGRTQPPSPQQSAAPPTPSQTNKANPKKKTETKDNKAKVYSIAFNGFFFRNVDVDDSGLKRRDPPQTSMLVLHHPPMPIPPQPRHLRLRLPPSTRRASTARTAPVNLLRMVNRLLQLQTPAWCRSNPIHYRAMDS
jgi:hypothetical protein